jgi:hypothetical protein
MQGIKTLINKHQANGKMEKNKIIYFDSSIYFNSVGIIVFLQHHPTNGYKYKK